MHAELLLFGILLLIAGLLARLGRRAALPSVPFFMLAGLLMGPGTPGPVLFEDPEMLRLPAALGLVLLLFLLGVEFPVEQVLTSGRRLLVAAFSYIGLNMGAGLVFGFALGWGTSEALVIAGALGISSSAIAVKVIIELRRLTNVETPVILGIIVIEDLFLACYLALLQPVLAGSSSGELAADIAIGFVFLAALFALARFGARLVVLLLGGREDEILTILVVALVAAVAGLSEELGVSEAIGALMIGLVVSRTALRERIQRLVMPVRDVLAAVFFVVFGLTIDVADMAAVVLPVLAAVAMTVVTNLTAGIVAGRLYGFNQRAAANTGLTVLGRGEFSLILASLALAAGLDERIGPFVALYVLILALLSPLLAAWSRYPSRFIPDRLLGGSWGFVRQETIGTDCAHTDSIRVRDTDVRECATCVAQGDTWVHLRLCAACGHVGCCDDSPNRHARAHAEETGHPVVRSAEPGEDWFYCFTDEVLVHMDAGRAPGPEADRAPDPQA